MSGWLTPPSLALPCAAAAAQAFAFTNHAPLVPLLMEDLAITPAQAGLLTTATFATAGVVSIPLGELTARVGPRRVVTGVMALLLPVTLLAALVPSYPVLLLTRVLAGLTLAGVFVAGGQYVNTWWRGDALYLAQGLHGGAIQLGIAGAIFVLPALGARIGWRASMALSIVPLVAVWLLWSLTARPTPPTGVHVRASGVYGNLDIWRLGLAHTAMFGSSIVLGAWVAVYLVAEFALPLAQAGMLGSLGLVLAAVGRPAGGLLVARGLASPRAVIVGALASLTAGLLVLAWPGRPLVIGLAGLTFAGLASSVGFASVIALVGQAAPAAPAAALGLVGLIATVSVIVGAPLIGTLYQISGDFTAPFVAFAVLPLVAFIVALPRLRDRPAPPGDDSPRHASAPLGPGSGDRHPTTATHRPGSCAGPEPH